MNAVLHPATFVWHIILKRADLDKTSAYIEQMSRTFPKVVK